MADDRQDRRSIGVGCRRHWHSVISVVPLLTISKEDGTQMIKQATTVTGLSQLANKNIVIHIPANSTAEAFAASVPTPADFDHTQDSEIVLNVMVAKSANADTLTFDAELYGLGLDADNSWVCRMGMLVQRLPSQTQTSTRCNLRWQPKHWLALTACLALAFCAHSWRNERRRRCLYPQCVLDLSQETRNFIVVFGLA
jgi:hypothetical protein